MESPTAVQQQVDVDTDPRIGLTASRVAELTADGRTNAFTGDSSRSAWNIVRANVFTLFNGIVGACFLVLLLLGRWQDALFGLAAFGNAIIGCWQEFRAKAALDKLALLNAPRARVRRDSEDVEIAPADVVQGDILVLRAGDQVTADAVVLEHRALQIDESMLTGESDAVDKGDGDEALSGSIVVAGDGIARAVRVGADSYANKFAEEAKRFSLVSSELRTSIDRVLKWVGWGIGPIGLLVLNAQMMVMRRLGVGVGDRNLDPGDRQHDLLVDRDDPARPRADDLDRLRRRRGASRGPAGARQRAPCRRGLARVDVICLDKTGTLTEGELAYRDLLRLDSATGEWQAALAWFGSAPDANATARCLREPFPEERPREASAYVSFSSARKWSALSLADRGDETWVLGAPEMVLEDAATDAGTEVGEAVTRLAAEGLRTLVLAFTADPYSAAAQESEALPTGLVPVAVITFSEKVRPDAAQTLSYFRAQGVGVRVISGDNPRTVAAIARQVGLDAGEGYDARQLPEDDAELGPVLDAHTVFGRVTPEQKKRMVVALQARGHTVAMTGDGVNDALAIKTADIGIAMNSGSPATKAVARLVLLDGQFSHLPDVVAEGRQVIANIERVSMLFLTKTVYATTLAVLFGVMVLEFPFLPRQLSITDGLTIGIPAFFLALMPNASRYVPGFLRRSLAFAIPAGLLIAIALTVYTRGAMAIGVTEPQLRTGSTIILAIVGIWVLSVLARPLNRYKVLVVGAMFIALSILFTVPLAGEFFQLVDPGEAAAYLIARRHDRDDPRDRGRAADPPAIPRPVDGRSRRISGRGSAANRAAPRPRRPPAAPRLTGRGRPSPTWW